MHTRPPVTGKRTPSGCRAVNDGEQTGRSDPHIIGLFTRSTPFSWTTSIVGDALHLTRGHLAARGESLASHRDGRGAPPARRDDREYREYLSEEQRSRRGCIARRMQPDFHHGL